MCWTCCVFLSWPQCTKAGAWLKKKKKFWKCICFLGVVQGMITGIRGLCNGLGPALYGFIFYIFHVELNEIPEDQNDLADNGAVSHHSQQVLSRLQGDGCCMHVITNRITLHIKSFGCESRNRSHECTRHMLGRYIPCRCCSGEHDLQFLWVSRLSWLIAGIFHMCMRWQTQASYC